MDCRELRSIVDDLIDGTLSAAARRAAEGHLCRCAGCRAFVDAERAEYAAVSRALHDTADVPPSSGSAVAARLSASFGRRLAFPFRRVAAILLAMLAAGCAAAIAISVIRMPSRPSVREYPSGGWACNTPKVHEVRVRQASRRVSIDGDLSEWTKPVFEASCNPPYDRDYSVSARMMWDGERLYAGGDVRTPDPLFNVGSDSGYTFAGGSVIVRLALDGSVKCPVPGLGPIHMDFPGNDRFASLVMYYDANAKCPRLLALRNMIGQKKIDVPPDAWKGAYRLHPDGRGYTFEYAFRWKDFGFVAPQPGERRPNHWNIHFSDKFGAVCSGQIVENILPRMPESFKNELPHRYFVSPVWGDAVFE